MKVAVSAAGRKKEPDITKHPLKTQKLSFKLFFNSQDLFFFNIGVVFNKDRQTGSICESKTPGHGCGVALHNQQNNVS